jgi:hypothetical protein
MVSALDRLLGVGEGPLNTSLRLLNRSESTPLIGARTDTGMLVRLDRRACSTLSVMMTCKTKPATR